jgi:mono/diheme cytochrome c family protein
MTRSGFHIPFIGNVVLAGLVICFNSCTKDIGRSPQLTADTDTSGCDTVRYTYNAEVKNIITANCSGCHFAGSPDGALTDHPHLQAKALDGSLLKSLRGQQGYALMPLTGPLGECDIKGIENWVKDGATNN